MTTGSLFNNLMGDALYPDPEVGMGATLLYWTDRHAATVVDVSANGKALTVQRDHATRTDDYGMSDAQSYSYEPDPDGALTTFTLRKNGAWVQKSSGTKSGLRLLLGHRDEHYDYSF